MQVHTIAAVGLPTNDMLVLFSTLRLRADFRDVWRCVDDPRQADVVLVLTDSPAARDDLAHALDSARPIRVPVVPPRMAPSPTGKTLVLPLRARDLLTHLRELESRLTRIAPWSGVAANAASMAMKPADLLRLLGDTKACEERVPLALRLGSGTEVLIELDNRPTVGERLRWRSSTLSGLPEFCRSVASGVPLSIDADAAGERVRRSDALCGGALSALVWAIATHDPHPEPATGMDDSIVFCLLRWPDFGALPLQPMQMRLSALISRRALSAAQLAAQAGATNREVVTFLNACHWLGILAGRPARLAPLASSVPERAEPAPRSMALLVRSIRQALRRSLNGGGV